MAVSVLAGQVAQDSNLGHLYRLLSVSREWDGEGTGQRGQQEAAAVHVGTVERMRAKINQPTELLSC